MSIRLSHELQVKMLYKVILRLHRGALFFAFIINKPFLMQTGTKILGLVPEMQMIGNGYVRDEFKRHKDCKPNEAQQFLSEWANYAMNLSKQLKPKKAAGTGLPEKPIVGEYLDEEKLNLLRDEQIVQLYELMQATKGDEQQKT